MARGERVSPRGRDAPHTYPFGRPGRQAQGSLTTGSNLPPSRGKGHGGAPIPSLHSPLPWGRGTNRWGEGAFEGVAPDAGEAGLGRSRARRRGRRLRCGSARRRLGNRRGESVGRGKGEGVSRAHGPKIAVAEDFEVARGGLEHTFETTALPHHFHRKVTEDHDYLTIDLQQYYIKLVRMVHTVAVSGGR